MVQDPSIHSVPSVGKLRQYGSSPLWSSRWWVLTLLAADMLVHVSVGAMAMIRPRQG